jgi:hypothetical protein
MLTKDILFGMNILTLAGFAVMGSALDCTRPGSGRRPTWSGARSRRSGMRLRSTEQETLPFLARPESPRP